MDGDGGIAAGFPGTGPASGLRAQRKRRAGGRVDRPTVHCHQKSSFLASFFLIGADRGRIAPRAAAHRRGPDQSAEVSGDAGRTAFASQAASRR